MASKLNDFGTVSDGLDRAELGVGPPVSDGVSPRPSPEALNYQKPSIRKAIGDNLLSVVVHPRYGINKIKIAVQEKHHATSKEARKSQDDAAPILAPSPPIGALENERLKYNVQEKPKVPPLKDFMHHPIAALQSTVQDQRGNDFAENIANSEFSHGADVHMLRQHDKIAQATSESEKNAEIETFVQMKQLKQDSFVRWTIDRHIRKVARVPVVDRPPQRPQILGPILVGTKPKGPIWSEYAVKLLEYELEKHADFYIDNGDKFPQPDRKLLASSLERVVIASVPLQTLFMKFRSISHWENPWETAGYMSLYFSLLIFSQITRMVKILYVIVITLYRGWRIPGIDQMRDTIIHSEDSDELAKNLTELVTQYGTRGYVDRVIELVGPAAFDWLERAADILEMGRKYMIFFSIGFDFFVMTPVARRYPKYRLLTSPVTWFMWRVPTHAEWAIARLQAEAKQYLQQDDTLTSIDKDRQPPARAETQAATNDFDKQHKQAKLIGRYSCMHNDGQGLLVATTESISFQPRQSSDTDWTILIKELRTIQKITDYVGIRELSGIAFQALDGTTYHASNLECRDEAFSQLVGYIGFQWKRTG
ncbi:hypothetical protein LTR05_007526 [Lithohypha guttulata]|uniref:Uncharacterized protein n=1 Tax=Lithohypha guttulata TaxID=1690604 RepID=A0AAN7SV94_9EURO|nr:hypothetical protein LTR05_007526 [Lithohypha guttulata]